MANFNNTIKASQAKAQAAIYNNSLVVSSKDQITEKYSNLFTIISQKSSLGYNSIKAGMTADNNAELTPILLELGYTISEDPIINNTSPSQGKLSSLSNSFTQADWTVSLKGLTGQILRYTISW